MLHFLVFLDNFRVIHKIFNNFAKGDVQSMEQVRNNRFEEFIVLRIIEGHPDLGMVELRIDNVDILGFESAGPGEIAFLTLGVIIGLQLADLL